ARAAWLGRLLRAWTLRPLACGALGFALGLLLGRPVPGAWPPGSLESIALGAGLAALWALPRQRDLALAAALALLGLSGGLLRVQPLARALADPAWEERSPLALQGSIVSDEGARPLTQRHVYVLDAIRVRDLRRPGEAWEPWPGRVRASVELET